MDLLDIELLNNMSGIGRGKQDDLDEKIDTTNSLLSTLISDVAEIKSSISELGLIDDITGAKVAIDYAHHEIHEGDSFTVADTVACDTTTVKWMIITPDRVKLLT